MPFAPRPDQMLPVGIASHGCPHERPIVPLVTSNGVPHHRRLDTTGTDYEGECDGAVANCAVPSCSGQGVAVAGKCANNSCSARRTEHEGKLFRLDLDIGNTAGGTQHKTDYIWLCTSCAQQMSPKVSVRGDTILVRLALTCRGAFQAGLSVPQAN